MDNYDFELMLYGFKRTQPTSIIDWTNLPKPDFQPWGK